MTVYAVMVFERHVDPDVELFTDQQAAVDRARALVREYAHPDYPDDLDEDLTEPMREGGWLYYGSWSPESDDYVFVIEREIQGGTS